MKKKFRDAQVAYLYLGRVNGLGRKVTTSSIKTILVYVMFCEDDPDGITRVISPCQLSTARRTNYEFFSGHVVDVPNSSWALVTEEEWGKLHFNEKFRKSFQDKYRINDADFDDFLHGRDDIDLEDSMFKVIKY